MRFESKRVVRLACWAVAAAIGCGDDTTTPTGNDMATATVHDMAKGAVADMAKATD